MPISKDRFVREEKTFRHMAAIYCHHHHSGNRVCDKCEQLVQYVIERVNLCPYGDEKPVCGKCQTHCYDPAMRQDVRKVMMFAGPRMIMHHPMLAIRHCIDAIKTPKSSQ
jgi:hypothetical protein